MTKGLRIFIIYRKGYFNFKHVKDKILLHLVEHYLATCFYNFFKNNQDIKFYNANIDPIKTTFIFDLKNNRNLNKYLGIIFKKTDEFKKKINKKIFKQEKIKLIEEEYYRKFLLVPRVIRNILFKISKDKFFLIDYKDCSKYLSQITISDFKKIIDENLKEDNLLIAIWQNNSLKIIKELNDYQPLEFPFNYNKSLEKLKITNSPSMFVRVLVFDFNIKNLFYFHLLNEFILNDLLKKFRASTAYSYSPFRELSYLNNKLLIFIGFPSLKNEYLRKIFNNFFQNYFANFIAKDFYLAKNNLLEIFKKGSLPSWDIIHLKILTGKLINKREFLNIYQAIKWDDFKIFLENIKIFDWIIN